MSDAIEALRESYVEQKEKADAFEAMSVIDFMLYRILNFLDRCAGN